MYKVMVILVIRFQFHFSSPLMFEWVTTHFTLRTDTYHDACNMVMIEAKLCAASLSLCYTATCYDIFECIGPCWSMRDSKYKDSTLHIQAEWTQIQWRRPALVCCFHEDYHIMTSWWQSHYPNWFPLYTCIVGANPRLWMPFNAQTKDCRASSRSGWVASISANTLFGSWTDTLQKSVQNWYIPFAYKNDIISEPMRSACLETNGTWQWGSWMQIWCT